LIDAQRPTPHPNDGDDMQSEWYEPDPTDAFEPADLVRSCIENGKESLLLDADVIPPEFFDLSTRMAGELLHRLGVYRLRMAAVVPDVTSRSEAFQAFVLESNRGRQYRFFATREEAVHWLQMGV
jgi:hypothetical protein